MDFSEAGMMIYDHLKYVYRSPSEFSSWSVSLLFVLQHALRKAYSGGEEDILIYVMDTRSLPEERIHYAPDLLKTYKVNWAAVGGIESKNKFEKYAQGEYLIHGKLDNAVGLWRAVNLDQLLDAGLW